MMHNNPITRETALRGALVLTLQAMPTGPSQGEFTIHAWIGQALIGSWPWDLNRESRPDLVHELSESLLYQGLDLAELVTEMITRVSARPDTRPEIPDRVSGLARAITDRLGQSSGRILATELGVAFPGNRSPGRAVAALLSRPDVRRTLANCLGCQSVTLARSESGPVVEIVR